MQKSKLEVKDEPIEPLRKPKSFLITPRRIALFIFVLFLILVGWYLWREIGFLIKPPSLEVSNPPADITATDEVIEILGRTDPAAYLTVNDEQVYIDKEGRFKVELSLSEGLNIVKIESKNRFNKTSEIIRRILYEKR